MLLKITSALFACNARELMRLKQNPRVREGRCIDGGYNVNRLKEGPENIP